MFKSFIEYGNNITTEEDMFNAFQYKWGMAGKKVILLDAPTINHPILKKISTPQLEVNLPTILDGAIPG